MRKVSYYLLTITQIVLGLFVITNYLTAIQIINQRLVPQFLTPFTGLGFGLSFLINDSSLIWLILILVYTLPGLLLILISWIKYRNSINGSRGLIILICFVLLSFISIPVAWNLNNYSKIKTQQERAENFKNIIDQSKKALKIDFISMPIPNSTTKIGNIYIKAVDVSTLPKGQYLLTVSDDSTTPIVIHRLNISEKAPHLTITENGLVDYNGSYGEVEVIQKNDQILIKFMYDNSGPDNILKSVTLSLKYYDHGVYNDTILYRESIAIQ